MVSVSAFLEFSLSAVHELDVHFSSPHPKMEKGLSASKNNFFKPLPPKAPGLEKDGKNDLRQAKITLFQTPCSPKAPAHKEDGKTIFGKRKSLFQASYPPKAPALQKDGKKRLSASENHFFNPYPFQGTSSEEEKKRFSANKNHLFNPPTPPKAPALEEDGKNKMQPTNPNAVT